MKSAIFWIVSWVISALIFIPCIFLWLITGINFHHNFHVWWSDRFTDEEGRLRKYHKWEDLPSINGIKDLSQIGLNESIMIAMYEIIDEPWPEIELRFKQRAEELEAEIFWMNGYPVEGSSHSTVEVWFAQLKRGPL